jgi:hypothetical protein
VWQRVTLAIVIAFLALVAWTAYRNVFADDRAVRAQAEKLARDTAGCGASCTIARLEGSRGMLGETITFTMHPTGTITVKCRRAYIAFGDYACTAAKR